MDVSTLILAGAATLVVTLALMAAVRSRFVRGRLAFSAWLLLAFAGLELAATQQWGDVPLISALARLAFVLAFVNLVVAVLVNPWRDHRPSERFPAIVQDVAVIALFLFHFRSALVAAITLPIASASTFIAFYYLDVTINIMSLAGVILALGDMVDSACVLVENAHKKIEQAERDGSTVDRKALVIASARELAISYSGQDPFGYKQEFLRLIDMAEELSRR